MEELWDEPELMPTSETYSTDVSSGADVDATATATPPVTAVTPPSPQLFSPPEKAGRKISHPIAVSPSNSSEGSEEAYQSAQASPAVHIAPTLGDTVASLSKWIGFSR